MTEKKMQHADVRPLDEKGTVDRQWKCQDCGRQGTIANLATKPCEPEEKEEKKKK